VTRHPGPAAPPGGRQRLFGRPYRLATIGSTALVFLAAFESLAVATVMPVIAADLGGRAEYALAFAATTAAGVVGLVAWGAWVDRRDPYAPLLCAVAVFAAGLAVAGLAPTMTVFVAARLLQGLGAGGLTVALNVLVAQLYPPVLHPRVFGLFAAAWVVPSMVGPFLGGLVADAVGWRWVFLGVLAVVCAVTAVILPVVRGAPRTPARPRAWGGDVRRIAAAVVVAAGSVVLSVGSAGPGRLAAPVVAVLIAVAVRPLLPAGTFRARPGLPATMSLAVVLGATFFSAEVYLPLLLHDGYGLPATLSGGTLTAGAIAWAGGSNVQGRLATRAGHAVVIRCGAALLVAGVAAELAVAVVRPHPVFVAAGWLLAGAGMGLMYPRIAVLVLAGSGPAELGFNTAARGIAEAVGASVGLALSGLVFAAAGAAGPPVAYVGTLAFSTAVGLLALPVAARVRDRA
jgi:MFS family permease